jgi:hypothetical protein
MAVLLSERRFSGGEGRGDCGGSGPWSGVGARRLEMPSTSFYWYFSFLFSKGPFCTV